MLYMFTEQNKLLPLKSQNWKNPPQNQLQYIAAIELADAFYGKHHFKSNILSSFGKVRLELKQ